jgi:MYXO-CTERM domain-containing protein
VQVFFLSGIVGAPAVSAAQDLVVTSFTVTVGAPAGTTVSYVAQVCNQGTVAAGRQSKLGLHFHRATAPGCADAPDAEPTINNLAAGACQNITYQRMSTPQGSYVAWATADWSCQVTETNEGNNSKSQAYAVRPDLEVTASTATVAGTTVNYSVTLRNNGAAAPGSFSVALYYNRAATPAADCSSANGAADYTWTVPGLAYNGTTTLTYQRLNAAAGQFTAWVMADGALVSAGGCIISETDETNNIRSAAYGVGPDLYAANPGTGQVVAVSGNQVTYRVRVCKSTSGTVNGVVVSLWYDRAAAPTCGTTGADFTWNPVNLTNATPCATLTHTRANTPGGSYTAQFFADATCAIAERDETDNTLSFAYTVPTPDLQVSAFTAVVSGSQVTYSATVCNQGGVAADNVAVGLYFDAATIPGCATSPSYAWPTIASLGPSQCTTATTLPPQVRNAVPAGTYNAWVRADWNCTVPESDETNNNKNAPYAVAPTQPDFYVSSFTAVPSGTTVTHTARVCNAGITSGSFGVAFYYDRAAAPSCGTATDATLGQSGLASGACVDVTQVQGSAPLGVHLGWAMADSGCVATESNENNNIASAPYTLLPSQGPDLVVDAFDVTVAGTTATYSATVCNKGNGAATSTTTVGLWYNRATAPSGTCLDAPQATAPVGALAVSACETKTWTQPAVAVGAYTAWAMADSACAVLETAESNNGSSKAYTVQVVSPDLGVYPDAGAVDSAIIPDAPAALDGGTKVDGAVGDAATSRDAAPLGDGNATPDVSQKRDVSASGDRGSATGDTGSKVDAGGAPGDGGGGCSCETGGSSARGGAGAPAGGLWLLALGGVVAWVRRRRRR